jgi:hypothetical protein
MDETGRKRVFTALDQFAENPWHPSLNFEKVKGTAYCTIRVNRGDRIALLKTGPDGYDLIDVGSHDYVYRTFG